MKKGFIGFVVAVLLSCFSHSFAQSDPGNMITAQPGFYIGPAVIPAQSWQVESSFVYAGAANGGGNFTLPTTLVRYGIVPGFEVRARYGLQVGGNEVMPNPLVLGLKTVIIKGTEKMGAIALRASFRVPKTGHPNLNPSYLAPEFLLATRQSLGPKTGLFVDAGVTWAGNAQLARGQYGVALEQSLTPELTFFIEPYGQFDKFGFHHDYDLGFIYLFTPNFQADLSGGTGFANQAYDGWFVSAGISFRVLAQSDRGK